MLSFNDKTNPSAYQAAVRYCRENGLFLKKFALQLEAVDLFENIYE